MLLKPEEIKEAVGFDLPTFIKKVKEDIGVGPIRLNFDGDKARAHAHREGIFCAISLPTRESIKNAMGLDEQSATAKIKAGLIEETCHCHNHETSHTKEVVGCTIALIEKHLTPEEQELPYIKDKIEMLRRAPELTGEMVPLPELTSEYHPQQIPTSLAPLEE